MIQEAIFSFKVPLRAITHVFTIVRQPSMWQMYVAFLITLSYHEHEENPKEDQYVRIKKSGPQDRAYRLSNEVIFAAVLAMATGVLFLV